MKLCYPRQNWPVGEMAVKPTGIGRYMHLGLKASILARLLDAHVRVKQIGLFLVNWTNLLPKEGRAYFNYFDFNLSF